VSIGPKMREAYYYVKTHPGCSKYAVARHIGPSPRFGDRAVVRALAAGIIEDKGDGFYYKLHTTSFGVDQIEGQG
jgi:hypothetical protein